MSDDEMRERLLEVIRRIGPHRSPTVKADALLPHVRAIAEAEYQRGHDDGWIAGQFDAEAVG